MERTIAGVRTAREQGKPFGAPRKLTDAKLAKAKKLLKQPGWNVPRVAAKFGVSAATIYGRIRGGRSSVVGNRKQTVKRKPKA